MVLSYICTNKCFFRERICVPGDVIIMDSGEGDAHPWFVRDPKTAPVQEEMQKVHTSPSSQLSDELNSNAKAKAPVRKAGAKAVDGGKAR